MSLTLGAADTITGVAGSATSITYTIFGDEISAGADAFKVLAQGQLPASVGTLYTVPGSTMAIVKNIHLVNGTGGSVTAALNVKGTAAANAILPAITILAGGFAIFGDDGWKVYNDQGQLLSVGATGATGDAGADGADGVGIPVGGTTAQRLAKIDGTDYNTEWVTPSDAITEITTIPTAETDPTLVLAPVGDGSVAFRAEAGGASLPAWLLRSPDAAPVSPNAADLEFASLTGTALGTPDSDNVTDFPYAYHIAKAAPGTFQVHGRYWTCPTIPFVMTAKVYDFTQVANYQQIGLMIAEASPGKLMTWGPIYQSGLYMGYGIWTNRTTRSSAASTAAALVQYFRMVVTSASSVALQISVNGRVWTTLYTGLNPGFTPGAFGIFVTGNDNSVAIDGQVDYVRFVTGTAGQTWNGYAWV